MSAPAVSLDLIDLKLREQRFTALVADVNHGSEEAADQLLALCNEFPELWQRMAGIDAYAV